LGFLEVGGDPNIVELRDLKQLLPAFQTLPDFYGLLPDDAGHRRINFCGRKIQARLLELPRRSARGWRSDSDIALRWPRPRRLQL
jgi:hypothetical protein